MEQRSSHTQYVMQKSASRPVMHVQGDGRPVIHVEGDVENAQWSILQSHAIQQAGRHGPVVLDMKNKRSGVSMKYCDHNHRVDQMDTAMSTIRAAMNLGIADAAQQAWYQGFAQATRALPHEDAIMKIFKDN